MDVAPEYDVRRHEGNRCVHCHFWDKQNPEDWSAPEGKCTLTKDAGHWPTGYWPYTLAEDRCPAFKKR